MKYLIHTCNERNWYVQEHLIPSMIEQGINKNNISVYLDKDNEGCLESCMKAFLSVSSKDGGTWHLQDDVIISSDFKEKTEQYNTGIVCGYCYALDGNKDITGYVKSKEMWYSFPCIRIPDKFSRKCANWYFNRVKYDREYRMWVRSKKYDDAIFHIFMEDYFPDETCLNLTPNLVDHIDYLIGGSVTNSQRPEKETHAAYFKDLDLLDDIARKLNNS